MRGSEGLLIKATYQDADVFDAPIVASTALVADVITTTETRIGGAAVRANALKVGDVIEIFACGRVTATGIGHPTVLMRLRWGGAAGTQLLISGAMFSGSSIMTDNYWSVKVKLTVRSIGAAGEIWASGEVINSTGAVPLVTQAMSKATGGVVATVAVTAVDQTAAADLCLTVTYSAGTAGNNITIDQFVPKVERNAA